MENEKSIVFIENAYCCGHGDIVHRLENWCLVHNVEYKFRPAHGRSIAFYNDKQVELSPTKLLKQVLLELGLQS